MQLYGSRMAPNSDRVELFLAEKGIDVPFVAISLMTGEQYSEDYRRNVAPNARVPALKLDDGHVIRESVAICRYFEETQPEPPLFGRTPLEKAQVEMWQRLMELELMLPIAMCFRHGHPGAAAIEKPQIADWAAVNRERAEKRMRVLDKELVGKEYLCGDYFSIADISAFIGIGFGRISKLQPGPELENLHAYIARIAARPAIAAARERIKAAA